MVDASAALLAKKEATYGTEAAVAAANAILTRNFKMTPLVVDQLDRKLDRPARGALPSQPSNPRQTSSFEVELAGSGAAGTAPGWMELLEACGMAPAVLTTGAGASAVQRMAAIGTTISSLTTWAYIGNQRRKGLGARGDISGIDFTAGAYPFVTIDLTALVPPNFADVQVPVADFSRYQGPIEVNTTNTSVSLDGYAVTMRSLRLQANAQVAVRNLVGANYVQRGNHALKGKLVIEAPSVDQRNFFPELRVGTQKVLAVRHGTVAGNIVNLDAGFLQILAVADGEEDDVAMLELDVQLNISAGQDDIVLTAK